mgnify:CR=1 FL=1|jgi:hypothetical protein
MNPRSGDKRRQNLGSLKAIWLLIAASMFPQAVPKPPGARERLEPRYVFPGPIARLGEECLALTMSCFLLGIHL